MDDRHFTYISKKINYSYRTKFKFSNAAHDDSINDCTIDNDSFLEESDIIKGLVELTDIKSYEWVSLLSGDTHISQIPELQHTSILNENERHSVDGYYYYSLQNGVVIFGIDKSHDIIKSVQKIDSFDSVKLVYDPDLLLNISTESRAKRRRNKSHTTLNICEITTHLDTYKIKLPQELSNLEVIETNSRLSSEPDLLLTEEGWLLILLNKDKTMYHRKINKLSKK